MNNKTGFTLVEVLLVLVLLGLIFGLGVPGIFKLSENIKNRSYREKIKAVENAAIVYGTENKSLLQKESCEIETGKFIKCKKIKIRELIDANLLSSDSETTISFKDPRNDTKDLIDHCVYIYRSINNVKAKYIGTC